MTSDRSTREPGYWEVVPDEDCPDFPHPYGERGWRPTIGMRHEHWVSCSERDRLNEALHRMIDVEPCETACTHVLVGQWTMLGLANVAARNAQPKTARTHPREFHPDGYPIEEMGG